MNFFFEELRRGGPYLRGCLVPLFSQKILGFGPSFCKMKLNTMQNFWQKGDYSSFWILASRGKKNPKRVSRCSHEGNKFCILDGTKHDLENFGILHFGFYGELNTP